MSFASAISAAAATNPMRSPRTEGRVLLVDGDALAYTASGSADCSPGQARTNLVEWVRRAATSSGAATVDILLTARGSHKGHRYAIARAKPYQAQRANSRRPENWELLRELLEGGRVPWGVSTAPTSEADDLFAQRSAKLGASNVVVYSPDKDIRMVPGWHLGWADHDLHYLDPTAPSKEHRGKQYGLKWFWLQMLHGDTADNIPGLPKYVPNLTDKLKPVGEVTAAKLLHGVAYREGVYALEVAHWYRSYYGDRWLVEMLEQACLLWLRRNPDKWDDCLDPGGPLASFNDGSPAFAEAYLEIQGRVRDADNINAAAKANAEDPNRVADSAAC